MRYETAKDWKEASEKRVMLFGMSGLGKSYLSNILRERGDWFHYSVDYRIGTRYMGEHIADNFKLEAMRVPLLRELLLSDSVYIASNITFDNLAPLSTYLGKPGDPDKGGLPFKEYTRRLSLHHAAEVSAMMDVTHFIGRARVLYGYHNFVCDSSGSICEVVDPYDPEDPVLKLLHDKLLMVWIEGSDAHTNELIRRFDKAPKPMYYPEERLTSLWQEFLRENELGEANVDPNQFIRFAYARALKDRQPRYRAMAERWGVTVNAEDVAKVRDANDFEDLVAAALEAR